MRCKPNELVEDRTLVRTDVHAVGVVREAEGQQERHVGVVNPISPKGRH
jgi:hypothetical protein